jgi:hypothetical protein
MRVTLFKLNKPQGFRYKPRYYSAEKEQAEKMERLADATGNHQYRVDIIAERMRQKWDRRPNKLHSTGILNRRLIIVAILVVLFIIWLF